MPASQCETRAVMPETRRRSPLRFVVAVDARPPELTPVRVLVAARAVLAQSEERPQWRTSAFDHPPRVCNEFWPVARAAVEARVRFLEGKSGSCMVEGLQPVPPVNQVEIAPMMLDVASFAPAVRFLPMHSCSRVHAGTDEGMASQAFLRSDLFPRRMAAGAVLYPFEPGVRLVKRAGRNLGRRRGRCPENIYDGRSPHRRVRYLKRSIGSPGTRTRPRE
jgi:hypothetical protein